nr:MAG TPA: hypothetical protein [Caudoviricetes sp.]
MILLDYLELASICSFLYQNRWTGNFKDFKVIMYYQSISILILFTASCCVILLRANSK